MNDKFTFHCRKLMSGTDSVSVCQVYVKLSILGYLTMASGYNGEVLFSKLLKRTSICAQYGNYSVFEVFENISLRTCHFRCRVLNGTYFAFIKTKNLTSNCGDECDCKCFNSTNVMYAIDHDEDCKTLQKNDTALYRIFRQKITKEEWSSNYVHKGV